MALLRFFKMPKHQRYDYKPRYWDPRKEDLQARLEKVEVATKADPEGARQRIAGSFRKSGGYVSDSKFRSNQTMRSNVLLFGIVIVLFVLSYLILSVYLPRILQLIEG